MVIWNNYFPTELTHYHHNAISEQYGMGQSYCSHILKPNTSPFRNSWKKCYGICVYFVLVHTIHAGVCQNSSGVLQLLFALLSLQLSVVESRQQVLMLPRFKVLLTPFKKWGHTQLFCICRGSGVSVHSGLSGWDLIIDTSNWLPWLQCLLVFFPFNETFCMFPF